MFSLLLPNLLIYKIKLKNKDKLEFFRIDEIDSYYIPSFITKDVDALISYGIGPTCQFEDNFTQFFKKPVYAFDCGNMTNICQKANFEPECIGTGDYRYNKDMITDFKIHYFDKKIKSLGLKDKKLYIKMNIDGAEDEVIDDILKNQANIIGISLYIDLNHPKGILQKKETLEKIEKYFIPISRNCTKITNSSKKKQTIIFEENNPYSKGIITKHVLITFINKNIPKQYYLPFNQSNKAKITDLIEINHKHYYYDIYSNISPIVVLYKKLQNRFGISYEYE